MTAADLTGLALYLLGPIPIILVLFHLFRNRQLQPNHKTVVIVLIYIFSFIGGAGEIKTGESYDTQVLKNALISGVIAPLICASVFAVVFVLFGLAKRNSVFAKKAGPTDRVYAAQAEPVPTNAPDLAPSLHANDDASKSSWSPIIIAAIIQAIATIIVALISRAK